MYLHHLMTNGRQKLAGNVLEEQMKNPLKGDFAQMCIEDLKEIEITIDELVLMTKYEMKKRIKVAISKAAFKYLIKKQDLEVLEGDP